MSYEINVSHYGSHLFATSERSLSTLVDALTLKAEFDKRFPESEGYNLTLYRVEKTYIKVD